MATADQLRALLESYNEGDQDRFWSVATQVAAHEARQGHRQLATDLKTLIDEGRKREPAAPKAIPINQPRGELTGLLDVTYPKQRLDELILPAELAKQLREVLHEQRQRARLEAHGLQPVRRILLIGPPGTGKTMTAAALAGELHLPLFTVQLDGLMSKFLGETAAKLRLIFEAMRQTPGVYFFDEFDALGAERATGNDVGEMRRVLNSFLQLVERDESRGLVLAATNHRQLLDHALFRRFELMLEYRHPDPQLAALMLRSRIPPLDGAKLDWDALGAHAQGLSHAEIARAAEQAAKQAILHQDGKITAELVSQALDLRHKMHKDFDPGL
jgi:SpoVK/Ycf46/Vps4 family AAA+-type ATPase